MTMGITSPTSTTGQILKNGSAVISFDANNNATFSGNVAPSVNPTMRNRIINGAMVIDQRNAGAATTISAGDTYSLDRWRFQKSGSGTLTIQQVSSTLAGFVSALKITVTGTSTPAASDYYTFGQVIEGYNVADLNLGTANNQPITISFWVQSSVTGTYSASIFNTGSGINGYPATFTINSANTWEYKTLTITGATSAASGTWQTTNAGSLYFRIDMGSGSTFNATANAWNSTGGFRTSSSVSLISNASATFYITGVQLEAGSVATPFEQRLYGTELALCQRYYLKLNSGAQTAYTSFGMGVAYTTTAASITVNYPVQMRANPTYNSGNSLRLVGSGVTAVTSSSLGQTSYLSSYITVNVASGLTTNNAYWFGPNGDSTAFIDFSAEI